jgi:tetratricopeptide (TPR) repeat protein
MVHLWVALQIAAGSLAFSGIASEPRLDRLRAWIAAVEQHQPGTIDAAATEVRLWDRLTIASIHDDLFAIAALIRDPGTRIQLFEAPTPTEVRRPKPGYTPRQMENLRIVADRWKRSGVITELLKRGALLHTDVALWTPSDGVPAVGGVEPVLQRTTLYLGDGRQQGLDQAVGHLDMARRLLDLVTPNPEEDDKPYPGRDETVREWYRATMAVLLERGNLDSDHFQRGLELFPTDAAVLFAAAALRETLAAPRIQDGVRTAVLPSGVFYKVDSERTELRRAEDLFRRSLAADAGSAETHLRLGRVLGLLDRPADAVPELRIAAAGARERVLRYYSELFLGRELDAIGERAQARESYARAAELFPLAQSPHIRLSEVAMRSGDRAAAVSAMQKVWQLSADPGPGDDPLWDYHPFAGRDGGAWLTTLNATFSLAGARSQ